MSTPLGTIIFVAVKPILKIYLIIGVGFLLVKSNMVSTETTRGLSNIQVNVLGPCLQFNKIVTNLSGSQIKNMGVFALSALVVFLTGFGLAVVVSLITPVPQKWKFGLLFAGIFSNNSDLPIAYVQSLASTSIFSESEVDMAVALVQCFNAVQNFLMINCGMFQIVGLDFKDESAKKDDVEMQETSVSPVKSKREESTERSVIRDSEDEDDYDDDDDNEHTQNYDVRPLETREDSSDAIPQLTSNGQRMSNTSRSRRRSSVATAHSLSRIRSTDSGYSSRSARSRGQTMQSIINEYSEAERIRTIHTMDALAKTISTTQEVGLNYNSDGDRATTTREIKHPRWNTFITKFKLGWLEYILINMARLPSLILIASLFVAMIPWVRALFVENSINIPDAPDNLPPLNFFMDFTSYVGSASVPTGLLLLGGTLARLKIEDIPKGFWKTVLAMVAVRLVILPIIGVLYTARLHSGGWIVEKVARFLMIVCWSCPTATSQVYFTAFYTPLEGPHPQMDSLALVLLAQYPVLVVALPFVVSYTLKVDLKM